MGRVEAEATLAVTLAYSVRPGEADEIALSLPAGATLEDALRVGGVMAKYAEAGIGALRFGIWGQLRPLEHRLSSGDRVEVYRALQVDPMEARRRRQRQQAARPRGQARAGG